jgi:pimeloyl-ACP methyl ester carboxylesterase
VRQSVTIWQEELDTWLPMNHARRLASLLSNSTLEVVAGASHARPLAVADKILEQLAP